MIIALLAFFWVVASIFFVLWLCPRLFRYLDEDDDA